MYIKIIHSPIHMKEYIEMYNDNYGWIKRYKIFTVDKSYLKDNSFIDSYKSNILYEPNGNISYDAVVNTHEFKQYPMLDFLSNETNIAVMWSLILSYDKNHIKNLFLDKTLNDKYKDGIIIFQMLEYLDLILFRNHVNEISFTSNNIFKIPNILNEYSPIIFRQSDYTFIKKSLDNIIRQLSYMENNIDFDSDTAYISCINPEIRISSKKLIDNL